VSTVETPSTLSDSQSHLSAESLAILRASLVDARSAHVARTQEGDGMDPTNTEVVDWEASEARAARLSEALGDLDHALSRLDAGTYGVCESCESPIPFERLEAIPTARSCVSCQGQRRGLLG
jgi:DnaK suppressor protein